MRQRPEPEHWLMRRDLAWDGAKFGLAGRLAGTERTAGTGFDGMQHADTDAISLKCAMSSPLEGKADRAIDVAGDGHQCRKIDVALSKAPEVTHQERSLGLLDVLLRDGHWRRPPGRIADGHVHAPQHLSLAVAQVANVAAFEDQRERAGLERDAFRWRESLTAQERPARQIVIQAHPPQHRRRPW